MAGFNMKRQQIISASRRTDIPAFYAEWFIDKIRRGYCRVANPYNASQIKKISLRPEDVAAIVFWTRRAKPLKPLLAELDSRGYNYYFLYTLTAYPHSYESGLPCIDERIDDFLSLAELIGPEKMIWRYDPIIMTPSMNVEFHVRNFRRFSDRLSAGTKSVIITFLKRYRHIEGALAQMGYVQPSAHQRRVLEDRLQLAASDAGITIKSCGKRDAFTNISEGKCIDDKLLSDLFGFEFAKGKDPGQPKECGCIRSVDIGRYGSCMHRCVYCYASRDFMRAEKGYRGHDYRAEML